MDQNNQFVNPVEQPVAPAEPVVPVYTQPVTPVYAAPVQPAPTVEQVVHDLADKAFVKALAAVIMATFPITSIIAIVMGSKALKLVNQARDIATPYGIFGGGKYMASRIMAMVGKYTGIAMTVFWGLYFLIFTVVFGIIFASGV